jgi:hypothetical protein
MTDEEKQKRMIAAMLGITFQERKRLYEKAVSLAGYEFDESGDEDEGVSIAWTGAGVYVNAFREPDAPLRREPEKPPARRTLLNYHRNRTPLERGLSSTGGI